jgi:inner membrane protein yjfL
MAMFVDEDATEELLGNNVAVSALFGAVSVSIGILNAACLT